MRVTRFATTPLFRKWDVEDRKVLLFPLVLALLFTVFFFDFSVSFFNKKVLYTIGSVGFIYFGGLPRNAVLALGSRVVDKRNIHSVQMWSTIWMGAGRAIGSKNVSIFEHLNIVFDASELSNQNY